MERTFGLGRGGSLLVREEGPRAVFLCDFPDDARGLYKAYFRGAGGRSLLGTLVPESRRLKLRRTLSIDELASKHMWPVTGGEVELDFLFGTGAGSRGQQVPAGWHREGNPARLMGDRVLSQAAGELRGALFRREEGGFALAAPFRQNEAFPMQPLFCFAHIESMQGRNYAVFHFNAHGCPIFQDNLQHSAHTDGAI